MTCHQHTTHHHFHCLPSTTTCQVWEKGSNLGLVYELLTFLCSIFLEVQSNLTPHLSDNINNNIKYWHNLPSRPISLVKCLPQWMRQWAHQQTTDLYSFCCIILISDCPSAAQSLVINAAHILNREHLTPTTRSFQLSRSCANSSIPSSRRSFRTFGEISSSTKTAVVTPIWTLPLLPLFKLPWIFAFSPKH